MCDLSKAFPKLSNQLNCEGFSLNDLNTLIKQSNDWFTLYVASYGSMITMVTHLGDVVHWKVVFYDKVSNGFHRYHRVVVVDNNFPFLMYWEVKVVIKNSVADVNSCCVYNKSYIAYQPHYIRCGKGKKIGHTR